MFTSFAAPQLRRGVLGAAVLALVEDQDRYGLEIVRALAAKGLVTSEGTIYPLLTRLQGAGVLQSEWIIPEQGRPRRFYRLTTSGREELEAFRAEWERFSESVNAIVRPTSNGRDTERE